MHQWLMPINHTKRVQAIEFYEVGVKVPYLTLGQVPQVPGLMDF